MSTTILLTNYSDAKPYYVAKNIVRLIKTNLIINNLTFLYNHYLPSINI